MTASEPGGARAPADPERLAEAERAFRAMAAREQATSAVLGPDFPAVTPTVLAEYDRRGVVEKAAAAYVLAGLCGDFEIPDGGAAHREKLAALIAAVRTNGAFPA